MSIQLTTDSLVFTSGRKIMCHVVVKWILQMLGIPKHTKVQEQQNLFHYFEEETFVPWS